MHPLVSVVTWTGTPTNGRDLRCLVAAGICLLVALHYLRRMFVPVGELARVVAAAAMVALSIGAALVLLVAISIGGR
jgi:hypothetical protein